MLPNTIYTKFILFSLTIFFQAFTTFSCDVCGCPMGTTSYKFSLQGMEHQVSLAYLYSNFKANIDNNSEYFPDETSEDSYHDLNSILDFSLSPNFRLSFNFPLKYHTMEGSHQTGDFLEPGDPAVTLLWKPIIYTFDWGFSGLGFSSGVKAPVGSYRLRGNQNLRYHPNFQPGTGSWDAILGTQTELMVKNFGLQAFFTYTWNGENPENYSRGNRLTSGITLVSIQNWKSLLANVQLGLIYNYAQRDQLNDFWQNNRGGKQLNLGTNLGFRVGKNALETGLEIPIYQRFFIDPNANVKGGSIWKLAYSRYFGATRTQERTLKEVL